MFQKEDIVLGHKEKGEESDDVVLGSAEADVLQLEAEKLRLRRALVAAVGCKVSGLKDVFGIASEAGLLSGSIDTWVEVEVGKFSADPNQPIIIDPLVVDALKRANERYTEELVRAKAGGKSGSQAKTQAIREAIVAFLPTVDTLEAAAEKVSAVPERTPEDLDAETKGEIEAAIAPHDLPGSDTLADIATGPAAARLGTAGVDLGPAGNDLTNLLEGVEPALFDASVVGAKPVGLKEKTSDQSEILDTVEAPSPIEYDKLVDRVDIASLRVGDYIHVLTASGSRYVFRVVETPTGKEGVWAKYVSGPQVLADAQGRLTDNRAIELENRHLSFGKPLYLIDGVTVNSTSNLGKIVVSKKEEIDPNLLGGVPQKTEEGAIHNREALVQALLKECGRRLVELEVVYRVLNTTDARIKEAPVNFSEWTPPVTQEGVLDVNNTAVHNLIIASRFYGMAYRNLFVAEGRRVRKFRGANAAFNQEELANIIAWVEMGLRSNLISSGIGGLEREISLEEEEKAKLAVGKTGEKPDSAVTVDGQTTLLERQGRSPEIHEMVISTLQAGETITVFAESSPSNLMYVFLVDRVDEGRVYARCTGSDFSTLIREGDTRLLNGEDGRLVAGKPLRFGEAVTSNLLQILVHRLDGSQEQGFSSAPAEKLTELPEPTRSSESKEIEAKKKKLKKLCDEGDYREALKEVFFSFAEGWDELAVFVLGEILVEFGPGFTGDDRDRLLNSSINLLVGLVYNIMSSSDSDAIEGGGQTRRITDLGFMIADTCRFSQNGFTEQEFCLVLDDFLSNICGRRVKVEFIKNKRSGALGTFAKNLAKQVGIGKGVSLREQTDVIVTFVDEHSSDWEELSAAELPAPPMGGQDQAAAAAPAETLGGANAEANVGWREINLPGSVLKYTRDESDPGCYDEASDLYDGDRHLGQLGIEENNNSGKPGTYPLEFWLWCAKDKAEGTKVIELVAAGGDGSGSFTVTEGSVLTVEEDDVKAVVTFDFVKVNAKKGILAGFDAKIRVYVEDAPEGATPDGARVEDSADVLNQRAVVREKSQLTGAEVPAPELVAELRPAEGSAPPVAAQRERLIAAPVITEYITVANEYFDPLTKESPNRSAAFRRFAEYIQSIRTDTREITAVEVDYHCQQISRMIQRMVGTEGCLRSMSDFIKSENLSEIPLPSGVPSNFVELQGFVESSYKKDGMQSFSANELLGLMEYYAISLRENRPSLTNKIDRAERAAEVGQKMKIHREKIRLIALALLMKEVE